MCLLHLSGPQFDGKQAFDPTATVSHFIVSIKADRKALVINMGGHDFEAAGDFSDGTTRHVAIGYDNGPTVAVSIDGAITQVNPEGAAKPADFVAANITVGVGRDVQGMSDFSGGLVGPTIWRGRRDESGNYTPLVTSNSQDASVEAIANSSISCMTPEAGFSDLEGSTPRADEAALLGFVSPSAKKYFAYITPYGNWVLGDFGSDGKPLQLSLPDIDPDHHVVYQRPVYLGIGFDPASTRAWLTTDDDQALFGIRPTELAQGQFSLTPFDGASQPVGLVTFAFLPEDELVTVGSGDSAVTSHDIFRKVSFAIGASQGSDSSPIARLIANGYARPFPPSFEVNEPWGDVFANVVKGFMSFSTVSYDITALDPYTWQELVQIKTDNNKPVLAASDKPIPPGVKTDFRIFDPASGQFGVFALPAPDSKSYSKNDAGVLPFSHRVVPHPVSEGSLLSNFIQSGADIANSVSKTTKDEIGLNIQYANVDYSKNQTVKNLTDQMYSRNLMYSEHQAFTTVYDVVVDKKGASLTFKTATGQGEVVEAGFIPAIRDLSDKVAQQRDTDQDWQALIASWGTHYPYAIRFGARGRALVQYTESVLTNLIENDSSFGWTLGVSASVKKSANAKSPNAEDKDAVKLSGSHSEQEEDTARKSFEDKAGSQTEVWKCFGGGGCGSEGIPHDAASDPVPVFVDFRPMWELCGPPLLTTAPFSEADARNLTLSPAQVSNIVLKVRSKFKQKLEEFLAAQAANAQPPTRYYLATIQLSGVVTTGTNLPILNGQLTISDGSTVPARITVDMGSVNNGGAFGPFVFTMQDPPALHVSVAALDDTKSGGEGGGTLVESLIKSGGQNLSLGHIETDTADATWEADATISIREISLGKEFAQALQHNGLAPTRRRRALRARG
jgi:hypothetical protein